MGTEDKPKGVTGAAGSGGTHHDPVVEHTPIIITDGSLAIEFAEVQHYTLIPNTNTNEANDLKLGYVQPHTLDANGNFQNVAHSDGSIFCHQFSGNDECLVVVTEQGSHGFTIHGFANRAPVDITFDHSLYQTNSTDFPQIKNGNRFGNKNSKLLKLLIFVDGSQVHDCELASNPGVLYEVKDPHTH
jgi:hypothetical protein